MYLQLQKWLKSLEILYKFINFPMHVQFQTRANLFRNSLSNIVNFPLVQARNDKLSGGQDISRRRQQKTQEYEDESILIIKLSITYTSRILILKSKQLIRNIRPTNNN